MVVWYYLSVSVSEDEAPEACYLGSARCGSVDVLARSHGEEECSDDEVDCMVVRLIGHNFLVDEFGHASE